MSKFNRKVGKILSAARIRTKLSIEESCQGTNFLPADLKEVECGLKSLPGYVLYSFSKKYKFTTSEMMFFCCRNMSSMIEKN